MNLSGYDADEQFERTIKEANEKFYEAAEELRLRSLDWRYGRERIRRDVPQREAGLRA